MYYVVDMTKKKFDRIDFTEAQIIDFFCQYKLPSSLEFNVWGATILLEPRWNHTEKFDSSLPKTEDMYVSMIPIGFDCLKSYENLCYRF